MNNKIVQSLWIGAPLSNLEKLCIQSFLDHGHEFHLYTYADVGKVPAGTIVKDATEILPEAHIFRSRSGSVGNFSDWFRYTLLAARGGVWADMDMVCLQPLDFTDALVLASELTDGMPHCTTSLIIAPKDHALMITMAKHCSAAKVKEGSKWGAVGGPAVLTEMVQQMGYTDAVKPYHYFAPLPARNCFLPLTNCHAGSTGVFGRETYTLHLYNELLRREKILHKDAAFDSASLIETLKIKHNIRPVTDAQSVTNEQVEMVILDQSIRRKRRIKRERCLFLSAVGALGLAVGIGLGWLIR